MSASTCSARCGCEARAADGRPGGLPGAARRARPRSLPAMSISGTVGGRTSVFDGPGHSVYVPAHASWSLTAQTKLDLAVCAAPGGGTFGPRLIGPDGVGPADAGQGHQYAHVRNILAEGDEAAASLLVVEVITPGGHWSSYPPHKHDRPMRCRKRACSKRTYLPPAEARPGLRLPARLQRRPLGSTRRYAGRTAISCWCRAGYQPGRCAHTAMISIISMSWRGRKRTWRFWNDPTRPGCWGEGPGATCE